ncbi:RagB/SusD family nutrient uptake outer membrane protein [uncultured Polaribacter sp.]|uniref:RagB/SusD family nutrient uptake outer membrane protein n=1 Tax=uncultured Polaribacter sp. TaxID=174711 RepID=UPI002610028D|nr:RagB/SusD family nutrient uptake outer membrane protein [uncultured Polaribacter sp.]
MKTIYNSIIVLFIILVGCNDELTRDPIGLLTIDQVDTTPTLIGLETSIRSSYEPLGSTLNSIFGGWDWTGGTVFRNDIILQDIAANDMNKKWSPDGDQAWMDEVSFFNFTSENPAFNGIWAYNYEGINRVNFGISLLTNNETVQFVGMSETRKNQLLGEAYFLRSFYYFDLINNFGNVPVLLTPLQSFQEAFEVAVNVPVSEVLAQINSDLSEAKKLLPNTKYPDPSDKSRVSKGAVIALQAKVAVHYGNDWGSVLNLIAELDALAFYSLNTNYFDSFDASKEFTDNEVIFAYDHRSGEVPNRGNGLAAVSGWGFFAPTENFINAFEPNDPRLLYTVDVANQHVSKILGSTIDYKGNDNSPGNRIFIRYADVLLWKAEALNENGDYPGAIAIINQIRARARTSPTADGSTIPAGTLVDRPNSTNPSQIKDWLMSERRVELGFESQRFNDLKRWKTAKTVLTDLGKSFQDHNYLYPIPQRDIDKSGGTITQNTNY